MASLKCLPCSFACLTCTNSATNCLSCHPGSFLQYNQCLSTCSVGYFQFNNACSPCSYPCATCSLSPLNCTSCQSLYIYFQSSCISLCPTTYYSTNNSCQPCRYPCRTCQTNYISLTTSAYCLSCVSNSATVYYLDSGACVTKCPENSYGDQSTLACRPCIFPCLTCSGPFSCLSCANGYLNRLKQTCSTCIMGWFADESSKQCSLCNSSIPNCSACLSSTLCTACVLPQIVFNGICISAAACLAFQGYFLKPQSC